MALSDEKAAGVRIAQARRTRENLLAAAREEFAARGLSGARTASIAAKANINPHAIFRNFGTKEGLYIEAVRSLFEKNWYLDERESLLAMSPRQALEEIMDYMIDRVQNDMTFVKIIADVNAHNGDHIRHDPVIRAFYDDMVLTIRMIVERGVTMGIFRPVDHRFLYSTITSAIAGPTVSRWLYSIALEVDYADRKELDAWHIAFKDMVLRGISAG